MPTTRLMTDGTVTLFEHALFLLLFIPQIYYSCS
jgi:hypothetical protein